jgi:hypothetical protein
MNWLAIMTALILAVSMIGGCVTTRGDSSGTRRQQATERHTEAVDRLVPEDGGIRPSRLRAVIEAIRTVRRDIPQEDLPQDANAVRRVLKTLSQSDLNRIESILPTVERRRQERGED